MPPPCLPCSRGTELWPFPAPATPRLIIFCFFITLLTPAHSRMRQSLFSCLQGDKDKQHPGLDIPIASTPQCQSQPGVSIAPGNIAFPVPGLERKEMHKEN